MLMDSTLILYMATGFLCVLACMLLAMPSLIHKLHELKFGQTEREEGLASHKEKQGTPTMGGIAFILIPFLMYCVFALFGMTTFNLNTAIIWISFIGYGLIGFLDDFIIVVKKDNEGLKPSMKFLLQSFLAVVVFLMYISANPATIDIPGFNASIDFGWFYFVIVFIMFTGMSNAVNLTDGVDGLCAGLSAIALLPLFILALFFSTDVAMIALFVIAALLGYLVFNMKPAKVFMGDTGSLALGGLLAAISMVLKCEILLVIISMVFVAETLSVMIQVSYYKKTKKRVFLMAPLHHHFEKKGWSENKVVSVFWVYGIIFALIGLWIGVM